MGRADPMEAGVVAVAVDHSAVALAQSGDDNVRAPPVRRAFPTVRPVVAPRALAVEMVVSDVQMETPAMAAMVDVVATVARGGMVREETLPGRSVGSCGHRALAPMGLGVSTVAEAVAEALVEVRTAPTHCLVSASIVAPDAAAAAAAAADSPVRLAPLDEAVGHPSACCSWPAP